jgi:hypothetical protein
MQTQVYSWIQISGHILKHRHRHGWFIKRILNCKNFSPHRVSDCQLLECIVLLRSVHRILVRLVVQPISITVQKRTNVKKTAVIVGGVSGIDMR